MGEIRLKLILSSYLIEIRMPISAGVLSNSETEIITRRKVKKSAFDDFL